MARFEDVSSHLVGPRDGGVKVVQFEPEENAVAIRPKFGVPEWAVMVLDLPIVQLEDQRSVRDQSLVVGPAVVALTAKEALIPATARFDVVYANERL